MLFDYSAHGLLNSLFGKTSDFGALAAPPELHLALLATLPDPGDTGAALSANEVVYTGYARVVTAAVDWNAAATRFVANAAEKLFPKCTGGSDTAIGVAVVDALTDGNGIFMGLLAPADPLAFQYETEDTEFVIPGHAFVDDDEVRAIGESLPTGMTKGTKYFVINATADGLQLSATQGGAALTLTTDGSGFLAKDGSLAISQNIQPKVDVGNAKLILPAN